MRPSSSSLLVFAAVVSFAGAAGAAGIQGQPGEPSQGAAATQPPPPETAPPAPPPPGAPLDASPMNAASSPAVDVAEPAKPEAWSNVQRWWLYTPDPSAPPPLHVLASVGAGYASIDKGAARPFAADVAHAGAVFNVGGELGIVRVLSFEGQVLLASESPQTNESVAGGGMLGLTLRPLPEKWPVQAAVSSGYLRELGGDNGVWFRAAVAGSIGRVRLGASALGEHVFPQSTGEHRDPLDVMITASASVSIVPWAQVGVEYAVQDLEELGDADGDDGGTKDFVALTASIFPIKHLQILAGPALGLASGAPHVLGRGQISYYF